MPSIFVETGDVTLKTPALRRFGVQADRPLTGITLDFDGEQVRLKGEVWPALIEQVKTRSLDTWKNLRMKPPMGDPNMQALLSRVNNTPTYQLFLAGFDIAETVGLVSSLPERVVFRRALGLVGRLPSFPGSVGLFCLPDEIVDAPEDVEALDQLILNNKLCRLNVKAGEEADRYYVPYATPVGFATSVDQRTEQLWATIRDYYYAFR